MVRIKLISRSIEPEDTNNYFKGFVNGSPVFSTVEEAKIMSTETKDEDEEGFRFVINKLRQEFQVEGKKYTPEEV